MKQIIQNLNTGETTIEEIPAPNIRKGHLLIRTKCSLISLGTEKMLVEFGKANIFSKARKQPDKVKMVINKIKTDGIIATFESVLTKLNQPLALGYSNVGIVIEVGEGVENFTIGDRVVSNGCHAEIVCVPKNLVAKIPDSVSDEEASFTVVASIALQGIRLANPLFGETVVVMGLGLIGQITCQLLSACGCNVIGYDYDQAKIDLARKLGIRTHNLNSGIDVVSNTMNETNNVGADAVIITASTPSNDVISNAANMSRKRGRIILVGVIGLKINRADFYEKELTFQVSCSYGPGRYDANYEQKGIDYPLPFVRWTENRNFQAILDSIKNKKLDVQNLITKSIVIDNIVNVYNNIADSTNNLGIIIHYSNQIVEPSKLIFLKKKTYKKEQSNIGIIGAGNFTQSVILPCLKRLNSNIVAIASNQGISANHSAKKYNIEYCTTDYMSIMNDERINTLIITTPHNSHSDLVIKGLQSNKHIFVEKPIAIFPDQLNEIINAYEMKTEFHLIVGFNRRYSPLSEKLKNLLKSSSSLMNIVYTVNAGFIPKDHWVHDQNIGGGRIIGEVCHFIDLLIFITNSHVVSLSASNLGETDVTSDNVSITLKFYNGSQAVINYFSNGSKAYSKERIEIFTDNKVLILDNFKTLTAFGLKNFKSKKMFSQNKGHQEQFNQFINSIENNTKEIIPFSDILNVSKCTFAILDSIKNESWISIN